MTRSQHVCGVPGCTGPLHGRGLCDLHRSRIRAGLPLVQPYDDGSVGVRPSGHGIWGLVTRTDTHVLCHECGRWLRGMGTHLFRTHELGIIEYRDRHGLAYDEPLSGAATTEAKRANGIAQRDRDPDAHARFLAAAQDARPRAAEASAARGRGIGGRARISASKRKR